VDRIVDVFPSDQQDQIRTMLAGSLRGVISQALLRRIDAAGRVAAVEVLLVNNAARSLIREGKTFQLASIIQTGRQQGMQSLEHDLKRLVLEGSTSVDEAIPYTEDPERLVDRGSPPVGGRGMNPPVAAGARFGR
jgi:twitching motility protein PilT